MHGAVVNFYGGFAPTPFVIPLMIIHDGVPKNRTVVLKLAPGNSVANLGAISTFTYTISNAFPVVSISKTNDTLTLTWNSAATASYTIESTPSLNPSTWAGLPPRNQPARHCWHHDAQHQHRCRQQSILPAQD